MTTIAVHSSCDPEGVGAKRVRLGHVPSGDPTVEKVKQLGAALIDVINRIDHAFNPETGRLKALACTAAEEAVMWAVKAQTAETPFRDEEPPMSPI